MITDGKYKAQTHYLYVLGNTYVDKVNRNQKNLEFSLKNKTI